METFRRGQQEADRANRIDIWVVAMGSISGGVAFLLQQSLRSGEPLRGCFLLLATSGANSNLVFLLAIHANQLAAGAADGRIFVSLHDGRAAAAFAGRVLYARVEHELLCLTCHRKSITI